MSRCGENIRKRADGRWEARVVQGRPVNRRTNYKYLYGKTYEDVRQKKVIFMLTIPFQESASCQQGQYSPCQNDLNLNQQCEAEQIQSQRAQCQLQFCPQSKSSQSSQLCPQSEPLPSSQSCPQSEPLRLSQSPAAGGLETTVSDFPASTVREVARDWLNHKKASVKESTIAYYTVMVDNHVIPKLGDISVRTLTPEMLSAFLTERKKSGRVKDGTALADKTVSDLKAIVKQMLAFAQSRGLLPTVPECPAVPAKQPPTSVFTKAEQEKIEALVRQEDTPYSLGVLLSLYGGPRIGEVCALKWEDFDFENETVRISKTISRIRDVDSESGPKTKVVISSPKTECSLRTIPLPSKLFAYLRARRKDGMIYVLTGTEKYIEPRVCRSRFQHLLQRAGVEKHTFHSLRHTYATRCVENNVDFKSLSEMMGHSDVKITMQRYVHPSMDFKKEQINKLPCSY